MNSAVTSNIGLLICAAGLFGPPSMDARAGDAGDGNATETVSLDTSVSLDIPTQPVETALFELSKQAAFQLLISDAIPPHRAPRVVGEMSIKRALDLLLQGTNLGYKWIGERTLAVVSRGHTQPASDRESTDTGRSPGSGADLTGAPLSPSSASPLAAASVESEEGKLPSGLEEIIVTAQKREERLIDVPQSVTVLSSDALAKLGGTQFRDFANAVPGLSFVTSGAGQTQVTLRGVTAGQDVGPTVGIYVDETPYGSSSAFAQGALLALDVGLFDVERIEVLRGPQGTLYGASTMGGVIKYVSKRPDASAFSGEAQAGISGTAYGGTSHNAAASVNAPIITDELAVRVSGYHSHDGGYIDNLALREDDVNRSDTYGGRLDVSFSPTEALTIRVGGFLQNIERDGEATADFTLASVPTYGSAGVPVIGSEDQSRVFAEPFDQRFRLVSGTATYDWGSALFTSVSSYQTARTNTANDLSSGYGPLLTSIGFPLSVVGYVTDLSTKKFTQEARLESSKTTWFDWVVGGFYTRETAENKQEFVLRDLAGLPTTNNLLTASLPSRFEEYAGFADVTYHLTSTLDVSGGVRYARNEQAYTQDGSGLLIGSKPTSYSDENVSTYLANARYSFTNHATGYLRFATGYRPGGPNFVTNDPTTGLPVGPATFGADRLRSYEAGFKAQTASGNVGIDLSGYFIDWSNIQVTTVRGGFAGIANAGRATVRGAELTLTGRVPHGVTATGAFAYQNGRLSEDAPDLGGREGERLPNVPRLSAAATVDYQIQREGLRPTLGATVRYVSDRTVSFDGSTGFPQYRLPAYTTVDLRTGISISQLEIQMYAHNLFDERGQLSGLTGFSLGRGPAEVSILQPRTIGARATIRF